MTRRAAKRISLKDIAEEAGVTVSTVSRILSNQTNGFSVRADVRKRVLQVVEQYNYRPNVLAQSLRKERMGIVGLLSVQMPLGYTQELIGGLLPVLEQEKVALCSNYSSVPHPVQSLPPWRIDGAIVVSSISAEETEPVERARIPYVCVNGVGGPNAIMVLMDDAGGTRQAIEYLVRLGHKRIAYANVAGPYKAHISVGVRYQTFLDVLKEAGLTPVPGHDSEVGEGQTDDFVRGVVLKHKATAVVAYHSYQATTLLQSLSKMGVRVPQHVSLLSLGAGYPLQSVYPTVTAVGQPFYKAGEVAGRALITMAQKPRTTIPPTVLPETLAVRQSTAPPPDNAP